MLDILTILQADYHFKVAASKFWVHQLAVKCCDLLQTFFILNDDDAATIKNDGERMGLMMSFLDHGATWNVNPSDCVSKFTL